MNKYTVTLLAISAFIGGISTCWLYIHKTPEPCRTISLWHMKAAAQYSAQVAQTLPQVSPTDFLTELTRKR